MLHSLPIDVATYVGIFQVILLSLSIVAFTDGRIVHLMLLSLHIYAVTYL